MESAFFYSIQLLEIIQHFEMLKNVINAVTQNISQVLYATFFGLLIINIYVFTAFFYLQPDLWMSGVGEGGESLCSSMVHCYLTVFSLGPRSSGGIGDMLTDISFGADGLSVNITQQHYWIRWVTDMVIFYVLNIIIMNLIFGVIISTFAELRDKKSEVDDSIENICSICS